MRLNVYARSPFMPIAKKPVGGKPAGGTELFATESGQKFRRCT
jgi:hypothetical protein